MSLLPGEIVVDSFAGGGGASEGITLALGHGPHIAINHDREAIALHAANHPESVHYAEDVWHVDPVDVCAGRPVGLMWLSPDCKHFSKAKGGKPVNKKVRGLAWLAVRWAKAVAPRVIVLENVEEFQTWGPLGKDNLPDKKRKGVTFKRFITRLRNLGYQVEWKELRACDYGAPTIRKRLFIIARRDGQPIVWPAPTHAKGGKGGLRPWRTAAECIDFSLPTPSIFGRKRDLAENTLRRIARGIRKFVLESPRPFIVNMAHGGKLEDVHEPLSTIATEKGGCRAVVAPLIVGTGGPAFSGKPVPVNQPAGTLTTQNHRALVAPTFVTTDRPVTNRSLPREAREPLPTVTSNGRIALASAFLAKHFGGNYTGPGAQMEMPLPTVTAQDHNAVVAAHITKLKGTAKHGQAADDPLHTVNAGGQHHALTAVHLSTYYGTKDDGSGDDRGQDIADPLATQGTANRHALVQSFLVAYFGNEKDGGDLFDPMRTVTSRDRFGLVTVNGVEYAIHDIGMRMLVPRELYNAQGFRPDYRIEIEYNGKPLSKTAQVRMVGNSVCPPLAAAIVRANVLTAQVPLQEAA